MDWVKLDPAGSFSRRPSSQATPAIGEKLLLACAARWKRSFQGFALGLWPGKCLFVVWLIFWVNELSHVVHRIPSQRIHLFWGEWFPH